MSPVCCVFLPNNIAKLVAVMQKHHIPVGGRKTVDLISFDFTLETNSQVLILEHITSACPFETYSWTVFELCLFWAREKERAYKIQFNRNRLF